MTLMMRSMMIMMIDNSIFSIGSKQMCVQDDDDDVDNNDDNDTDDDDGGGGGDGFLASRPCS